MTTSVDVEDTYIAAVLRAPKLASPTQGSLLRDLTGATLGAALYGLGLASFSGNPMQLLASGIKMPILLIGAALLCFPTFHFVQIAHSRDPLNLKDALRVVSTALAATGFTWAALSPPVLFLVTTSHYYGLARGIAVAVGAAGGVVGLIRFRTLLRAHWQQEPQPAERWAMRLYGLLFSVVGLQLAWVLRPFIGSPFLDFTWFRALGSTPLAMLFGGGA